MVSIMSKRKYTIKKFLKDGMSKNMADKYFDKTQLKRGIKVEHEHTGNRILAKKIAKDHLVEFPDYYTRLAKMERQAEKYWTKAKYEKTRVGRHLKYDHRIET